MKQLKYFFTAVFLLTVSAFSQQMVYSPFTVNEQKTSSISLEIKSDVDDAKIVDVNHSMINEIVSKKSEKISVRLPLDNKFYDLTLERFDILAPGFKVVGGTQSGDRDVSSQVSFVAYTSALHQKNTPTFVLIFLKTMHQLL